MSGIDDALNAFRARYAAWTGNRGLKRVAGRIPSLTQRELEVFYLLGSGASNTDLMRLLYLSSPTVKGHVSQILAKLNVTRLECVAISALWAQEMRRAAPMPVAEAPALLE